MSSKEGKTVLVTGATGKVGQNFIRTFMADPTWANANIRLCATIVCWGRASDWRWSRGLSRNALM